MNAPSPDGPPSESPLDVERVEWLPATPDTVRVLVVGRWRTAPPVVAPILVIDDGTPIRVVADEHTTIDGSWQATFTVPIELRPRLERRLGLQIGEAELSLPAASAGPADESAAPPPATVVDQTVLDERRARRFEGAEESLVRRAQAAEATAATLRTQLEHLEARLREAVAECDSLERNLRSAEQREEAERRVRQEATDERDALREESDRRAGALRARLRAAELHAAELAREMDAVRREGAEAQQAAVAARRAAEKAEAAAREREAELAARLGALGAEAGDVGQRLAEERGAREAAERALGAERDRVATLQGELERRGGVAVSVRAELEELRADLERVRAEAEAGGEVTELRATAAGLRARIEELERAERGTREDLERRAAEVERGRVQLESARAELAAARDAEAARAAALRDAERAADEVRREAADARRRIEDERKRRFEVEAELRAELEREREELGSRLAAAEGTLRAQLAAERRAFEEQTAAIERTARKLRERLSGAAAELEARLSAGGREHDELRAELEEARREIAARAEREAEVGALVADLLATSTSLREGFERELRGLEEEVRGRLSGEGDGLRRRLQEVEEHMAALRDELERERAAREAAERELAEERGARPPNAGSEAGLAELDRAKSRVADAEEQLERSREREDLHAQARAMIHNLEEAEQRLRAEREALAPGPEERGTDPDFSPPPAEPPEPESATSGTGTDLAPPAKEVPVPDFAPPEPESAALLRAAEELAAAQREAAERAAARRAARRAATGGHAAPVGAGSELLRPRVVDVDRRRPTLWLTTAIERFGAFEPRMAARLVTALLPVQGPVLDQRLTYELAIDGDGAFLVRIESGEATVEPQPPATPPDPAVEVRVAGPAAVLAPLVAGGAGRRLKGARLSGRRRRLRPLLRARREPVTLVELSALAQPPEPGIVLRALAAAIEPEWTAGHRFSVVYDVNGSSPATHHLVVADGAPVIAGTGLPEGDPPAATLTVTRQAFLPLLARLALPPGERVLLHGDADAFAVVHRWTDRLQGIPTDD